MFEGCRLETHEGDDGPIVVKTATDDAGRARLQREVGRLEQARHPGIVHLVAHDGAGGRLVLGWAGDQTLELVRPTVPAAAAILAAVATTVADLHELGVIHGRLEPSHVIIGADGRPRLCGLAGREPAERPATPADDVGALGHLIDHLLGAGAGAELEPIPERRWARRRPVSHDRRALLAVADRATQEDLAQRPTARSLALLIADAVPTARLDRPDAAGAGTGPDPLPTSTAALLLPPPIQAVDHPDPGPAAETGATATGPTTRWSVPAAFDEDPAAVLQDPEHEPDPESRPEPEPEPVAALESESESEPEPVAVPVPVGGVRFLGLRIEPGAALHDPPVAAADSAARSRPHAERAGRVLIDEPPLHRERVPQVVAALAVAVVAVVAVAGGWLRLGPSAAAPAASPTTSAAPGTAEPKPDPTTTAIAPTTSVPADRAPVCPATPGSELDLDRDGCPDPYQVDGTSIIVDGQRWTVGEAGDEVALGDWNCDGEATPALLRPATGEVFLFVRWPQGDQPLNVAPTVLLHGASRFAPAAADQACGAPRVVLADGSDVAIEGEGARP
ncbi:hypothetical protein BH10ACT1_BH10ACT1_00620 [soil metagenome]